MMHVGFFVGMSVWEHFLEYYVSATKVVMFKGDLLEENILEYYASATKGVMLRGDLLEVNNLHDRDEEVWKSVKTPRKIRPLQKASHVRWSP